MIAQWNRPLATQTQASVRMYQMSAVSQPRREIADRGRCLWSAAGDRSTSSIAPSRLWRMMYFMRPEPET